MDGDADPRAVIDVDVLFGEIVIRVAANLLQIERKAGLELLHIHFEIVRLAQLLQLLNNEHGIVLIRRHQQIVICQSHQAVQLVLGWRLQEMESIFFEIGIIETAQDVAQAEALRNSLELLVLLLVEGNIIVLCNIANRREKIRLQVLLALFLLNNNCSFQIEIILFAEDIIQGWVLTSINSDLMKFVPEIILHGLLFECFSLKDDIVLSFEDDAAEDVILLLQ